MKIGTYRGKEVADMDRGELLEFAKWASKRIEELEVIERDTQNFRIEQQINRDFSRTQ